MSAAYALRTWQPGTPPPASVHAEPLRTLFAPPPERDDGPPARVGDDEET